MFLKLYLELESFTIYLCRYWQLNYQSILILYYILSELSDCQVVSLSDRHSFPSTSIDVWLSGCQPYHILLKTTRGSWNLYLKECGLISICIVIDLFNKNLFYFCICILFLIRNCMLCAPFYTMLCTCLVKTLYGINYNNNNRLIHSWNYRVRRLT